MNALVSKIVGLHSNQGGGWADVFITECFIECKRCSSHICQEKVPKTSLSKLARMGDYIQNNGVGG